jgi:DNA gyrase subunit A
MGRTARGVRGINLSQNDKVVGMDIAKPDARMLIVTESGFSKRTPLTDFRQQTRGGKGVIGMKISPRNGLIVGLLVVSEGDEIMIITQEGIMIRVLADDISIMGRSTQGVKTMRISDNDHVVALARVAHRDEDENL